MGVLVGRLVSGCGSEGKRERRKGRRRRERGGLAGKGERREQSGGRLALPEKMTEEERDRDGSGGFSANSGRNKWWKRRGRFDWWFPVDSEEEEEERVERRERSKMVQRLWVVRQITCRKNRVRGRKGGCRQWWFHRREERKREGGGCCFFFFLVNDLVVVRG
ncbi:hypothetical protein HAX54_007272 [Datura stramonium]|uniref:Uncharacterized protein n=1 Tax=Datura stramonium TaxID=4076 RepID=A0ABS8WUL4_DATST|nr:hypothetical protein [Datura stramonium]